MALFNPAKSYFTKIFGFKYISSGAFPTDTKRLIFSANSLSYNYVILPVKISKSMLFDFINSTLFLNTSSE